MCFDRNRDEIKPFFIFSPGECVQSPEILYPAQIGVGGCSFKIPEVERRICGCGWKTKIRRYFKERDGNRRWETLFLLDRILLKT